jgi:hypothetical protein
VTFLLSEDKALRVRLQGMTVNDQKSANEDVPRQVSVFYGQPDQEIRAQSYPYVTIDMVNVQRDPQREVRMPDSLPDYKQPEEGRFVVHERVPVYIDYQVTSYARHPRHDREIISQLLEDRLPIRFGSLDLDDNTVRRLDVLNVSKRDSTEQAKRLFVNAITVRISSEISFGQLEQLYEVLSIHIDNPTPEREGGRPGAPYFNGVGPSTITS